MDPFSQAALGAVVGTVAGHRTLGHRAAAYGALAGALPDIDVLFSISGDYFDQLVTHRGITHSLLFAPVAGPALGWALWRLEARRGARRVPAPAAAAGGRALPGTQAGALDVAALAPPEPSGLGTRRRLAAFALVVTLALLSHPLLDTLTPYGTQLLLPFSDARFAVPAMPIIDPVYTVLLVSGIWLAARFARRARAIAGITLAVSTAYLGYGWQLNMAAAAEAQTQLERQGVPFDSVHAFPTIGQIHYRRVVVRAPGADRAGFISMWAPCEIDWGVAPRLDPRWSRDYLASREGAIFEWFTGGMVHFALTPADAGGGAGRELLAADLRYGFDTRPERSVFSTRVPVRADGSLAGPVRGGRTTPSARSELLAELVEQTYAPACRLLGLE